METGRRNKVPSVRLGGIVRATAMRQLLLQTVIVNMGNNYSDLKPVWEYTQTDEGETFLLEKKKEVTIRSNYAGMTSFLCHPLECVSAASIMGLLFFFLSLIYSHYRMKSTHLLFFF